MKKIVFILSILLLCPFMKLAAQPAAPVLKSLSLIHGSDSVLISWEPSISPNIKFYRIYKGMGIPVGDTIFGGSTMQCVYVDPDVLHQPVSLCIGAFDSLTTVGALSNYHTTNFLAITPDSCRHAFALNWAGYGGWGASLAEYQVWYEEAGSAILPVSSYSPVIHQAQVGPVINGREYCMYVMSKNVSGDTSFSNRICDTLHFPVAPAWINLDYATVTGDGHIDLQATFDITAELLDFLVLRSSTVNGPYDTISPLLHAGSDLIRFTDNTANTNSVNYYKAVAVNACRWPENVSNPGSNIVLEGTNNLLINQLSWNSYFSWIGGIAGYSLTRYVNGSVSRTYSLGPSDTAYEDDISDIEGSGAAQVCYRVQATENASIQHSSNSNPVCLTPTARVKMPNAFTPGADGVNDEFRPVFDFIPESYLFKIFDRTGALLFESTSPGEGWNGTGTNGKPANEGMYVWYLKFSAGGFPAKELRGTLSLIYH